VTEPDLGRDRSRVLRPGLPPSLVVAAWFLETLFVPSNRSISTLAQGGGLVLVAVLFNLPLCMALEQKLAPSRIKYLRAPANLAFVYAAGHLCHWGLAAWAYLLSFWAAQGAFRVRRALGIDLALTLAIPLLSLLDGVAPFDACSAAATTLGIYWLAYTASGVGDRVFEELDAQYRELEQAHEQRRQLQESAIQKEKLAALGMLASGIVHEINTPLSFVGINVESLQGDLASLPNLPEPLTDHLETGLPDVLEGLGRINSIVSDLRIFARTSGGPLRPVSLNEAVERALRLVGSQLKFRYQIVKNLGDLPALNGLAEQLTQVAVNLVVNASQAIPYGGTIEVTTRREGHEALLSVRDNGSGMDEETRHHAFEPFFTTRPVGRGPGLGLSVIHGIVVAHGGRVEVESEPGKGSCFTVRLPLDATSPAPQTIPSAGTA
jgi:two-component system, NtrC family, sensor kinase